MCIYHIRLLQKPHTSVSPSHVCLFSKLFWFSDHLVVYGLNKVAGDSAFICCTCTQKLVFIVSDLPYHLSQKQKNRLIILSLAISSYFAQVSFLLEQSALARQVKKQAWYTNKHFGSLPVHTSFSESHTNTAGIDHENRKNCMTWLCSNSTHKCTKIRPHFK